MKTNQEILFNKDYGRMTITDNGVKGNNRFSATVTVFGDSSGKSFPERDHAVRWGYRVLTARINTAVAALLRDHHELERGQV